MSNPVRQSLIEQLNVPNSEAKWSKQNRLHVRRVLTTMFLSGNYESLTDAASWVFEAFDAQPTYLHPFIPVTGLTAKAYAIELAKLQNEALLSCNKAEFVKRVKLHVKEGGQLDALLYADLFRPKMSFNIEAIEMLTKAEADNMVKESKAKIKAVAQAEAKAQATAAALAASAAAAPRKDKSKTAPSLAPAEIAPEQLPLPLPVGDKAARALSQLVGESADLEELNINILYLNDTLNVLVAEQRKTQNLISKLLSSGINVPPELRTEIQALEFTEPVKNKRQRVLVVGLWPKQYEGLRMSFNPTFFEHIEIDYVSADKLRKYSLSNAASYDYVCLNTKAINHTTEDAVRKTNANYDRYGGGVSALKSLLIGKANMGDFGDTIRTGILDWAN